jgi:hypothetical protein
MLMTSALQLMLQLCVNRDPAHQYMLLVLVALVASSRRQLTPSCTGISESVVLCSGSPVLTRSVLSKLRLPEHSLG